MELLIRSQNKMSLIKYNKSICISENNPGVIIIDIDLKKSDKKDAYSIFVDGEIAGTYLSKARALEVFDEINSKIKSQYLVKCNALLKDEDMKRIKRHLTKEYLGDFILEAPPIEIKPLNSNIIYYEMPEK